MQKRSAEASIKGYNYQFLHTVIDILSQDDATINTIEGIEDLDIYRSKTTELCQYKYHELQNYRNSLVGKPIGLMFNHFINNPSKHYNYKLILYVPDEIPTFDQDLMKKILKLKAAQDYISEENKIKCDDNNQIKIFLDKFNCILALEFSKLEEDTIIKLSSIFNMSIEECKFGLLPNALKEIIEYGIKSDVDNRRVTTADFKKSLKDKKDRVDVAYISRIYGEDKATKQVKKRMKSIGIKKNCSEYIIFLSVESRCQTENLILDIVKKFYYKGNKNDFKPVTFIIDNMGGLKTLLVKSIKTCNEIILFNDGYEDYDFFHEVFNQKCITTGKPLSSKVNDVNFNFKLISLETYEYNKKEIKFMNPTLFCIDIPPETFINNFERIFYINTLSSDNIVSIIGG